MHLEPEGTWGSFLNQRKQWPKGVLRADAKSEGREERRVESGGGQPERGWGVCGRASAQVGRLYARPLWAQATDDGPSRLAQEYRSLGLTHVRASSEGFGGLLGHA